MKGENPDSSKFDAEGKCFWKKMNNGLYGGRVLSLSIDSDDTNVIYISCSESKVFKYVCVSS